MGKKAITFEMLVPEDCFGRRLEKLVDFEWVIEKIKPHVQDTQDRTAAAVRAVLLILIEHLEPYALRSEDKPLLASIYDSWQDNTGYMWLLQAVPWSLPVYRQLTDFEDIPTFEDIFYPVADNLPCNILCELLDCLLHDCVSSHIEGEYPDQTLYYMNQMDPAGQEQEIRRLAQEYAKQFYQEVAVYRANSDGKASPAILGGAEKLTSI